MDPAGQCSIKQESELCESRGANVEEEKVVFRKKPNNILVVKKPNDLRIAKDLADCVLWLAKTFPNLTLYVEAKILEEDVMKQQDKYVKLKQVVQLFAEPAQIDLVVTLGGDGTLLYAASLFPCRMPPVASFRMGHLNFLAPYVFEANTYRTVMRHILSGGQCRAEERMRLLVQLPTSGVRASVVNDVVLHRGDFPGLVSIKVSVNGKTVATVSGDGVIISTPTGSSAYCMSAGGAILHPYMSAIQMVPIAPHSLCNRPVVFMDTSVVELTLTRGRAKYSLDGRAVVPLNIGETLTVTKHLYPLRILIQESDPGLSQLWLEAISYLQPPKMN